MTTIALSVAFMLSGILTSQLEVKAASPSDGSILGTQVATADQMAAYALSVNPSPKINCTMLELAKMYLEEGAAEGVRGDIAFAQACNETGTFAYGGTALSAWNNYSGLGVTGVAYNSSTAAEVTFTSGVAEIRDAQGDSVGVKFSEPRLGVRAQIQHLKGYATTAALKQAVVDPRYSLVSKGIAPGWLDLNGIWAVPGTTYGQQILAIYDKILGFPKGTTAAPTAAVSSTTAAADTAKTAAAESKTKALTGITVTPPAKTEYTAGQKLDLKGLAVTGKYDDGTDAPLAATAANVSGFNSSITGSQTLTVTVEGKKAAFNVNVIPLMDVISGPDIYTTAAEISKKSYASADTVILASGTNFPDGLSAGPLAVQENAPILLTEVDSLPQSTLDEIKRLKASKVIVMGGEEVVGQPVAVALGNLGIAVERISGNNRFVTAMETAKRVREKSGETDKVVLVNGYGFGDAISSAGSSSKEGFSTLLIEEKAGVIDRVAAANEYDFADVLSIGSYASKEGIPILLTETSSLTAETKAALIIFGIKEVQVAGDYSVVSQGVENEIKAMGITVTRINGGSRFGTSVNVAGKFFSGSQKAVAANGSGFAGAFAAVPLAAKMDAPIILVEQGVLPAEVSAYMIASKINCITIVGGDSSVGQAVKDQLFNSIK